METEKKDTVENTNTLEGNPGATSSSTPSDNLINSDQKNDQKKDKKKGKKKKKKVDKKEAYVKKKLKENIYFYYGFPLAVGAVIMISVFFFIVPFVTFFPENQSNIKTVDENMQVVNTSASNLSQAINEESLMISYIEQMKEYVPAESKPGTTIDLIQQIAGDYNLEVRAKLNQDIGAENSSINQIVNRNRSSNDQSNDEEEEENFFESIASGETEFTPEGALSEDTKARLIAIELIIEGRRGDFFDFIREISDNKPIINLIEVDYTEDHDPDSEEQARARENGNIDKFDNGDTNKVEVTLRLESYALLENESESEFATPPPLQVDVDDPSLTIPMTEENFDWRKEEIERDLSNITIY